MTTQSISFDVTLSNVPIVNLRWEFRKHYRLAKEGKLIPLHDERRPLQTPYFLWLAMPDSGATLLIVRTILSLEAYMSYAGEYEGAKHGLFSPQFIEGARNPFSLGGKGTADSYYNRLPRLIDSALPMSNSAPSLWTTTKAFYTEIRNPLFHGHELRDLTNSQVGRLFEQIASTYRWIDSWFDPEPFLPGARTSFSFD